MTTRYLKGIDYDGWDAELQASRLGLNEAILNERLKLRLYRIPGYLPQWKFDQSLDFEYNHPFSATNRLIFTLNQQEYVDKATRQYPVGSSFDNAALHSQPMFLPPDAFPGVADRDRITTLNFNAGGRFLTENGIELEGTVGPTFERRSGIKREGILYNFGYKFTTDSIEWRGKGWLSHFGAGDDHNILAEANGTYYLSEVAENQFQAGYQAGRRREFSAINADVGVRDDSRLQIENRLSVNLTGNMVVVWNSNLKNQTINSQGNLSDRHDREFNWQNELGGTWSSPGQFIEASSAIDVQQQEYSDGLTQGRNSRIHLAAGLLNDKLDSSLFQGTFSYYRFDTPDDNDFNDRDELRWLMGLRSGWRLNDQLQLLGGLEANLNHIVYLHRSRSAENRWTRQFTAYSEVPWQDTPVKNWARFAVSAHYTDYDFSPFDLTESRLFRTFTAVDSFRFEAANGWGGELSLSGQLYDHGELDWADWVQNVSEKGFSYTVTVLPFVIKANSELSIGWVFHRRFSTQFENNGDRLPGEDILAGGPTVRLYLEPVPSFMLELLGTVLKVRQSARPTQTQPDVRLTVIWAF